MELWTAFILGLAGSLHCAGMCGPIALVLPMTGGGFSSYALGRVAYNLGRLAAYCLLGVAFGLAGKSLVLAGAQRWVSIGAGVVILMSVIVSPQRALTTPPFGILAWLKSGLASLLRRKSIASLLLLGCLNGLLPCGLVYVAGAGATTTGGLLSGVEYMLLFGLGTWPMMLAISLLGKTVRGPLRLKFQKVIPVCLLVMALLLILRGLSLGIPFLSPDLAGSHGPSSCCH